VTGEAEAMRNKRIFDTGALPRNPRGRLRRSLSRPLADRRGFAALMHEPYTILRR